MRSSCLFTASLVALALVSTGCGGEDSAAEFRSIHDLRGLELSADLAPWWHAAADRLDGDEGPLPAVAVLRDVDRLDGMLQRRASRRAAADTLVARLTGDPEAFVWMALYDRHGSAVSRIVGRRALASTPPRDDPTSAAGAFWRASAALGGRRVAPHMEHLEPHVPDLAPLDRTEYVLLRAAWRDRLGHHQEAARLLLAQLDEAASAGGGHLESRLWRRIAAVLTSGRHTDDAVHAAVMAVAQARRAGSTIEELRSRQQLGDVLAASGAAVDAYAVYRQVAARAQQEQLPWIQITCLSKAAGLATTIGDIDQALDFDLRSLWVARAEEDSVVVPRIMVNIAHDQRLVGRADSSASYLARAGRWIEIHGSQQNNAYFPRFLAEHYCFVGDYARAESLLAVAQERIPRINIPENEIAFLTDLVRLGRDLGRPAMAYRALARVDELRRSIREVTPERNVRADLEIATADLLGRQGEFARATEALERAAVEVEARSSRDKAWDLNRARGELAQLRGDLIGARKAYIRCLALADTLRSPDLVAESRQRLARVYVELGETTEARALFDVDGSRDAFGGRFRTRLEADMLSGLAWARDGDAEQALRHYDRALERGGRQAPPDLTAELRALRGRALVSLGRPADAEADFRIALDELERSAAAPGADADLDVARRRAVTADLLAVWQDHPDLCGKDAAAVSLAWLADSWWSRDADVPAPTVATFVGPDRSFMWVGDGRQVTWHRLPGREDLRRLLAPVVADLGRPDRPQDDRAAAELAATLLEPIMPVWPAGRTLDLLADDLVWSVPWAALPHPGAAGTPLVDHGAVRLLPGWPRPAAATAGDERILAVGYDGAGTADDRGRPLRRAEAEARDVAALWPDGRADLRVGAAADWTEVLALDLARFDVIHIATHTVTYQGAPGRSTLRLATDDASTPLTPGEISALDLDTRLVFLSCCETARPLSGGAGGLAHFAGAFIDAGARTVIASSQIVDDAAAAEVARRFYRRWLSGGNAAESLRATLAELRREEPWRHPFYWGNYRVVGGGG